MEILFVCHDRNVGTLLVNNLLVNTTKRTWANNMELAYLDVNQ